MTKDWLALGLSGLAAVAAIMAFVRAGRIEEEVQTLRSSIRPSDSATGGGERVVRDRAPSQTPPPADEDALEVLRKLEARLAALERPGKSAEPRVEPPVDGAHADVEALCTTVLDRSLAGAQRVEALRRMRRMKPDPRTPEVARSMLDLLQTSPDAEIRAEICRHLKGIVLPELGVELVTRLRVDADDATREEAAESLESYLDQPGVEAALDYARLNDPSEEVRKQAAETMSKKASR